MDEMRKRIEKALSNAIAPYIESMSKGISRGGFPMKDGAMVGWSLWIARRQIDEVMAAIPHTYCSPDEGTDDKGLLA